MKTFLEEVAESLYSHYGDGLKGVDLVFASRRAYIYFGEALKKLCGAKPRYFTIDRWITSFMEGEDSAVSHKFLLVVKLFEVYRKYYSEETLDSFYSFGELLLSDFDMVDRYMVDCEKLYSNVADLKEMESEFRDEDLAYNSALEFWRAFDKNEAERVSELEFKNVWSKLSTIYREFNELCDSEGLLYSGKIYRRVAERFASGELSASRPTVFVGLNALSRSEKEILGAVKREGKGEFVWDYSSEWFGGDGSVPPYFKEAAYFIASNIEELGRADFFSPKPRNAEDIAVEVVTSPSDYMQAKITGKLLDEIAESCGSASSAAVVLTDEKLLLPLLHSLPKSVGEINISMGYPLASSPSGQLVSILTALYNSAKTLPSGEVLFRNADLKSLLYNSLIASEELKECLAQQAGVYTSAESLNSAVPELSLLWRRVSLQSYLQDFFESLLPEEVELEEEQKESEDEPIIEQNLEEIFTRGVVEVLSKTREIVQLVASDVANNGVVVSKEIYQKILGGVLNEKRIDFEGVSGSGLQIMGILETRSLDFERVILLSLSDDNFPSSRPDNSYIPPILLQGFGMPSMVDKSAIWSYYFFRLLQRVDKASLLYCNVAEGTTSGEASRYILQMKYSGRYNIQSRELGLPSFAPQNDIPKLTITKSEEVAKRLKNRSFSPSALVRYMQCPLNFYFHYIERLRESDEEADLFLTPLETGNIVHHSLEKIYAVESSMLTDEVVSSIIAETLTEVLGEKQSAAQAEIGIKEAVSMVYNVQKYDKLNKDGLFESFFGFEKNFDFEVGGYKLNCIVDRMDNLKGGHLRVIDYKTGKVELKAPSIEEIFTPFNSIPEDEIDEENSKPRPVYKEILQVLIYCLISYKSFRRDVNPRIYATRRMTPKNYKDYTGAINIGGEDLHLLSVEDYQSIENGLTSLLSTICDPAVPFVQTRDEKHCAYCAYKLICQR